MGFSTVTIYCSERKLLLTCAQRVTLCLAWSRCDDHSQDEILSGRHTEWGAVISEFSALRPPVNSNSASNVDFHLFKSRFLGEVILILGWVVYMCARRTDKIVCGAHTPFLRVNRLIPTSCLMLTCFPRASCTCLCADDSYSYRSIVQFRTGQWYRMDLLPVIRTTDLYSMDHCH